MSAENPSTRAEDLLEQAGWVRRLARHLVADLGLADDLSQETLVRALEHPPRAGLALRSWLARVLQNLVRERRRGEARRLEREERAARGESLASAHEVVEKVTTQRLVVQALLELEEPYRTALLLRYFEDCSPRRIARETGAPLPTVKSRLARGLEKLRARLDRQHGGDGRTWGLALLPLAARPLGASPPFSLPHSLSLGAIAVNAQLLLSLAVVTAFGAALAVLTHVARPSRAEDPARTRAAPARVAPLATHEAGPAAAAEQAPAVAERQAAAVPERETPLASVPAPAGATRCRGRVIDL